MKSLQHLYNEMSDSVSDVPALVPSSDEEDVIVHVIKTNAECVDIWLSKRVKFLEKQEHNIHIFSLGPFIMGLETFISKPWFFCLFDAKLLNVTSEKPDYTKLSDEEWQNLEVIDVVTKLVVKKMRKKKFLVNTLDMVDKIEESNRGDGIDVKHSIQNATRYSHIHQAVWEKVLSLPKFSNNVHKVKFATLYVCKLCHMVITSLAREGKDIAEDFKKSLKTKCGGPEKALDYKDQGNQQYSQQKYADAIKLYTDAIKSDPFNHLCYGNRAQAFQKQDKFYEALADGHRAVLMKPDWIKGYYRYAQACYHTGNINMAIAINKKGMRICEKTKNSDKMLSELKDQGKKLQQEKYGAASDEPKAVVRSRTILKLPPTPAATTAPPSPRSPTPPPPHAPLSPEITVLNALINHSDEYFLPAVENIRPASPIMEDRQYLDMSLGVDNDTLLTPKSQQQRLYQNLGKKIDKINQNLNTLSQEQTAMRTQFTQFSTSMNDQMAQLTTLVQQLIIQGRPPAALQAAPEVHLAPPAAPPALPAAPETFLDIPEPHRISLADLQRFKDHSHNPGHLGVLLTQRLFPELFGADCLRRQYSYYGAGKLNKTPLDAEKKTYLQRYVLFLYPELQEDRTWKDTVVCRVNEVLRRPAK